MPGGIWRHPAAYLCERRFGVLTGQRCYGLVAVGARSRIRTCAHGSGVHCSARLLPAETPFERALGAGGVDLALLALTDDRIMASRSGARLGGPARSELSAGGGPVGRNRGGVSSRGGGAGRRGGRCRVGLGRGGPVRRA